MENSIESIWKEGFLNEKSLVVPKINDLYNQKSKHVVDKVKRRFRVNLIVLVIMSIVFPIIHYFLDAFWQGVATSVLLLLTAWYSNQLIHSIKTLDQGATSLDYLKSFDRRLKDVFSRSEKIVRFSYPLYFLIAISSMWSAWNKGPITSKMYQKYPDVIFIGSVPLFVWIIAGVATLLMLYFSGRIYRWDVRLMYGRVFDKLEETIAEMEKLKEG
jgi:amino acid permease